MSEIYRLKSNQFQDKLAIYLYTLENSKYSLLPISVSVFCYGFDATGKTSRILSWWCFNPGIAMEEFSRFGVRSIVLTSGTLSPMDSFAEELKL